MKNGGSAFPYVYTAYRTAVHHGEGMTLRDYFAGQALGSCIKTYTYDVKKMAEKAYEYADAMLAERDKK